jgi:Synaptobrevin
MMANSSRGLPFVLWACVARDDTILAEAGDEGYDGGVSITARELLNREPTPGWEFHTQSLRSHVLGPGLGHRFVPSWPKKKKSHWTPPRLKGAKFHVYERDNDGEYIVWVFACVYDPNNISKDVVQTFLTKLVVDTEAYRADDFQWQYGPTLACQESFAPLLRHYMMQVSHLVKYSAIQKHVETAREKMSRNIELLLERDNKLEELNDEATHLQEMALAFKRRAKDVKRIHMWQNAKHGMVLGAAITAGVALVTVPPLIALL